MKEGETSKDTGPSLMVAKKIYIYESTLALNAVYLKFKSSYLHTNLSLAQTI